MELTRSNQQGVALISTLFFLVIVTVVASGALMLSTVQTKVAGSIARWEGAFFASEAAFSSFYAKLKDELYEGRDIDGPGEEGVADPDELIDRHYPDRPMKHAAPDIIYSDFLDDHYIVHLDRDVVGVTTVAGFGIEIAWAYHGMQHGGGRHTVFRLTGLAQTPSGSARSLQKQTVLLPTVR